MSLNETGRTGVKVNLTADGVFGIVTQDPESMLHSPGGMENAAGNSGFGQRFTLMSRPAQTASGTSTATFASSDAPFKFRVVGGEIECLQDARGRTRVGDGRCSVNIMAGSTNTVASVNCTEMKQGDVLRIRPNTLGNEVIASSGSLSAACVSVLPSDATSSTWELLIKLDCVRVI